MPNGCSNCVVFQALIHHFFDGLNVALGPGVSETQNETETLSTASLLSAPGALELLADYARLKSSAQRKKVIERIKILADND